MKMIAIAVVEHDNQFLVGQRPLDVPLGGLWEFPGGKVEANEPVEAAAIRECLEETGLQVEITGQYAPHEHKYPHGAVRLHFFACRPVNADQAPLAPYRWIPRRELATLDFPAGNHRLLDELLFGNNKRFATD